VALATGSALAAIATALSTELGLATRLVFHFHPIAILAGSAWAYRRLTASVRARSTRSPFCSG
jgi:hypothetical protein